MIHETDLDNSVFDREFFDSLEGLKLPTDLKVIHGRQGERIGRRHGDSIEYAELRPYEAGDDLRSVDWNAYRRLRRLLVRQYQAELSQDVYILLDSSASVGVDPAVLVASKRIAGALAVLAARERKRCVLLPFSDRLVDRLAQSRRGILPWEALSYLSHLKTGGGTDVAAALRAAAHTVHRGSALYVISDFFDEESSVHLQEGAAALRTKEVTLYGLHVYAEPFVVDSVGDRSERARAQPPGPRLRGRLAIGARGSGFAVARPGTRLAGFNGMATLYDSESGSKVELPIDSDAIRLYQEEFAAFQTEIQEALSRAGGTYLPAPADQPFWQVIGELSRGSFRSRHGSHGERPGADLAGPGSGS